MISTPEIILQELKIIKMLNYRKAVIIIDENKVLENLSQLNQIKLKI
jgi:hypothetical protein